MGDVKDSTIYSLCDALGMNVDVDPKTMEVTGSMTRTIQVGQLKMEMPLKVVASRIDPKGCYMLLLRAKGNLAVLITARNARVFDTMTLDLVNVARMSGQCQTFFADFTGTIGVEEAREKLGKAIVKSFKKINRNDWAEA
jgi:hypothetical protein